MLTGPLPEYYDYADSDNVCFLCGNPRFSPYRESTHFGFPLRFQRCACGLIKQTPMPNKAFFEWFFNSEIFLSSRSTASSHIWGFFDYLKDEPCRLATSRSRYKRLRALYPQQEPIDVLKIGPSTGTFLHVAQKNGDNAIGCDISSKFVEYAAENYGVHIDHGRFEDLGYRTRQFDMVLMLSVLENIEKPAQLLAEVHRTLKEGGRFVFNYVEMKHNIVAWMQKEKYFLFRPPVTYIYNGGVLTKMLEASGFEIELNIPDMRIMHLEKILTLLGWNALHVLSKGLRLSHLRFPTYAYPSRIVVAKRVGESSCRL
jgi:ubiquinone/menaquinone biosynthesis C-methylase UbiE